MRRFLCIVLPSLLLAAAPAPSHAFGLDLGLKGGVSVTKVQSDLFDSSNRTGFVGGGALGIGLTPGLTLQPEVLFVRKGVKLSVADLTGTVDVDYLEIPLLLRVSLLPVKGPLDLRLLGGPVASFKSNQPASLDQVRSDFEKIKDADYGLALGGALVVQPGGTRIVAEGRYTFGLTDVIDLASGSDGKNRAIYAMLGLEFPLFGR